ELAQCLQEGLLKREATRLGTLGGVEHLGQVNLATLRLVTHRLAHSRLSRRPLPRNERSSGGDVRGGAIGHSRSGMSTVEKSIPNAMMAAMAIAHSKATMIQYHSPSRREGGGG
ncbi:hypothetical protein PENTCL1PPCAC_3047, partial [Pristionchus entomophagus]